METDAGVEGVPALLPWSRPGSEFMPPLDEGVARGVAGVTSAISDRAAGGRYLDIRIRRDQAARYGLSQARLQSMISMAVGGAPISETVDAGDSGCISMAAAARIGAKAKPTLTCHARSA